MRERGGGEAEWMENLGEGERRGWGWMDGGVGGGREEGLGLDGCGSGMRKRRRARLDGRGSGIKERGGSVAGWMGEWDEGERWGQGWIDAGVK